MLRHTILLIILFCIYVTVMAQTPSDWQIIIFHHDAGTISRITADGVSDIDLPTSVHPTGYLLEQYLYTQTVASSMDGRYIAYLDTEFDIHIIDTVSGECCQSVESQYIGTMKPFDYWGLGAVSPDGTAVAQLWVTDGYESGSDNFFAGEVAVVDVDGNITRLQDICNPLIGHWLTEGIEIIQICQGGDGPPLDEHYTLWHPDTGWNGTSQNKITSYGDYLPTTDEQIKIGDDLNYLYDNDSQLHGHFNVLRYQASSNSDPELIYAANEERYLESPAWVADGRAVILYGYQATEVELIFRDGHYEKVIFDNETRFIASTPDGWITLDLVNGDFLHYTVSENHEITVNHLDTDGVDDLNFAVVYRSTLGASVITTGFEPVPQDLIRTNCFNDLRFRLTIGRSATVVPGSANNVRSEPTTASEVIGQIPSGPLFKILDGPVCAQNMAWWQVDYDGLIGWTADGQGDTYWIEPFIG